MSTRQIAVCLVLSACTPPRNSIDPPPPTEDTAIYLSLTDRYGYSTGSIEEVPVTNQVFVSATAITTVEGQPARIAGKLRSDAKMVIEGVPLAPYVLELSTEFDGDYPTDPRMVTQYPLSGERHLRLGDDLWARKNRETMGTNTKLSLSITTPSGFEDTDYFCWVSLQSYFYRCARYYDGYAFGQTNPPVAASTTSNAWTIDRNYMETPYGRDASGLPDAAAGDDLHLTQARAAAVPTTRDRFDPWSRASLTKVVASLRTTEATFNNESDNLLNGTLTAPPTEPVTVDIKGSTFATLRDIAQYPPATIGRLTLNATQEVGEGPLYTSVAGQSWSLTTRSVAQPLFAACYPNPSSTQCNPSACPVACASALGGQLDPGDFTYSFEAPRAFGDLRQIEELTSVYTYTISIPGRGFTSMSASSVIRRPKSDASFALELGAPTNIKVDGKSLSWANSKLAEGSAPLVTFDPPTLGTPEHYRVELVELLPDGGMPVALPRASRLVAQSFTREPSMQVPAGVLRPGRYYYFRVTAIIDGRTFVDLSEPTQPNTQRTAIFTPPFQITGEARIDPLDSDGDLVPDESDLCIGDDTKDADRDGVPDACDVCLGDDTQDTDGDTVPNDCDRCAGDDRGDADDDGVPDACDICPAGDDAVDSDFDSFPDACDVCNAGPDMYDDDNDGVPDACDVCPANDDQADADGDGVPDACDSCDGDDTLDADGDSTPDACDPDTVLPIAGLALDYDVAPSGVLFTAENVASRVIVKCYNPARQLIAIPLDVGSIDAGVISVHVARVPGIAMVAWSDALRVGYAYVDLTCQPLVTNATALAAASALHSFDAAIDDNANAVVAATPDDTIINWINASGVAGTQQQAFDRDNADGGTHVALNPTTGAGVVGSQTQAGPGGIWVRRFAAGGASWTDSAAVEIPVANHYDSDGFTLGMNNTGALAVLTRTQPTAFELRLYDASQPTLIAPIIRTYASPYGSEFINSFWRPHQGLALIANDFVVGGVINGGGAGTVRHYLYTPAGNVVASAETSSFVSSGLTIRMDSSGAAYLQGYDGIHVVPDYFGGFVTPLITPASGPNGSISPSTPGTLVAGGDYTLTATPNGGYIVDQWFVDGELAQNSGTTLLLENVFVDHDVLVTFGQPALATSVSTLALKATGVSRQIVLTNAGTSTARALQIGSSPLPLGTVFVHTCGASLAAGDFCTITVVPGTSTTSTCNTGIEPTPSVISVAAAGLSTINTNVVVLDYGCIHQGGYLFSIDDSTPTSVSIGGKVLSQADQGPGSYWSTDTAGTPVTDSIYGIAETSTVSSPMPSSGLIAGQASCNGATDGACNTHNITIYHNSVPASLYAAGLCRQIIDGYSDWALPAICELGYDTDNTGSGCGSAATPLQQNVLSTLIDSSVLSLSGAYWSSTQVSALSSSVWQQLLGGTESQILRTKSSGGSVRCIRALTP